MRLDWLPSWLKITSEIYRIGYWSIKAVQTSQTIATILESGLGTGSLSAWLAERGNPLECDIYILVVYYFIQCYYAIIITENIILTTTFDVRCSKPHFHNPSALMNATNFDSYYAYALSQDVQIIIPLLSILSLRVPVNMLVYDR